MRVEGVDMAAGACRVAIEDGDRTLRGLAPDALLGGGALRPGHRADHEALARQPAALTRALRERSAGRVPRPPYDVVTLRDD